MLRALLVRDFRLLWAARLAAMTGAGLLVVAVPAHVYAVTGSVLATGFTLAAEYLPVLLLGPFAGVAADRWDRRMLMLCTDLAQAAAVPLVLLARAPDTVWLVYLAMLGAGTAAVLFRPAAQAHTPAVVGTGRLLGDANALSALSTGVVTLAAPLLGGLLYATAGVRAVVAVAIGCSLLSALAIACTRRRPRARAAAPAVLTDLRHGLHYVRHAATTRALLAGNTIYLLANAALTAMLVPFAVSRLGGGAEVGYVLSALGLGFVLGAPLGRRIRLPLRTAVTCGQALVAGAFFVLFNAPSLVVALVAAVLVGVPGVFVLVTVQTWVQRATPDGLLGRVSAVFLTTEAAATLAGALAGPVLGELAGLAVALNAACSLSLAAAAVSFLLVPRDP